MARSMLHITAFNSISVAQSVRPTAALHQPVFTATDKPLGKAVERLRIGLRFLRLMCAAGAGLPLIAWGQSTGPANLQDQVIIIGTTPLPGLGVPLNEVPSNIQTATSQDMQRQQSLDLTDYINNNFSGVNASEGADNPFQMDVYYHGFTASPLLGTPEGLSVYVDGVRVNESFGDTVNWDLIPESAISTATLVSGSNPVFGLNTLGGAIAINTKNGRDNPGTELEAYGGSFGRYSFEAETGGSSGPFDWFFTGNYFDEKGWRDESSTTVNQGFAKVGYQADGTHLNLSYTYADDFMGGDGPTPLSMLDYRRAQTYTPDSTQNHMNFLNLTGSQLFGDKLVLSGNVYYRNLTTFVINGNINDNYLAATVPIDCTPPYTTLAALSNCTPGQNVTSPVTQKSTGFGLQLTDSHNLAGFKNQATVGVSYDNSKDTFSQAFDAGGIEPPPAHLLIYYPSPYNGEEVTGISGTNKIFGLYITDTLSPNDLLHFTASARYNRNTETLNGFNIDTDVTDIGDGFNSSSPVTGDNTFSRVNPAIGFTVTPTNALTFFADYNEASRAPTVIELGCANPAEPCGLPDDFASDPPLKQVVARTAEIGARGTPADQRLTWSVDAYRTVNSNDIQFIASAINSGYFDNVGSTRRQGFDVTVGGKEGEFTWRAAYSYVNATYQSTFTVNSESNSTADVNGNIIVSPGDRIPLTPRSTARLILAYDVTKSLNLGANVIYAAGSFLHGDENNANLGGATDPATGAFIQGSGWLPGYTLVNFNATYHATGYVDVFARVVNAFNVNYGTAGFLTDNVYNPNGTFRANPNNWTNEDVVAPGAPRGIWAGFRVRF